VVVNFKTPVNFRDFYSSSDALGADVAHPGIGRVTLKSTQMTYGAGEVLHVGDSLEADVAVNFRTPVNFRDSSVRSGLHGSRMV